MDNKQNQLTEYYNSIRDIMKNERFIRVRDSVYARMNQFREEHPHVSAAAYKSELHMQIAMTFDPVVFDSFPFYYEMGIRPAESWGFLQ